MLFSVHQDSKQIRHYEKKLSEPQSIPFDTFSPCDNEHKEKVLAGGKWFQLCACKKSGRNCEIFRVVYNKGKQECDNWSWPEAVKPKHDTIANDWIAVPHDDTDAVNHKQVWVHVKYKENDVYYVSLHQVESSEWVHWVNTVDNFKLEIDEE